MNIEFTTIFSSTKELALKKDKLPHRFLMKLSMKISVILCVQGLEVCSGPGPFPAYLGPFADKGEIYFPTGRASKRNEFSNDRTGLYKKKKANNVVRVDITKAKVSNRCQRIKE